MITLGIIYKIVQLTYRLIRLSSCFVGCSWTIYFAIHANVFSPANGFEMVKKKQPCIVDTLTSLSFNFIITQKLWQHLTLDQISYCHHLTPFREKEHYYIELVLAWIEHSDPSQTTVSEIWASLDYQRLSEMYLEDVKEHLLLLGYTVPAAPQCVYSNDTEAWFWSRAQR